MLTASLAPLLALLALLASADREADWQTLRESKDVQAQVAAARAIAKDAQQKGECGKVAAELIELGTKFTTPELLRDALARGLAGCGDAETAKQLTLRVGGGQEFEKLFVLKAAEGCADEALDRAVRERLLPDKSAGVRAAALGLLVRHRSLAALPAIEAILREQRDLELLGPALQALSSLRRGGPDWPDWETRLVELVQHKLEVLRTAALAELALVSDVSREELFLAALRSPDWPARAIAVEWIEKHYTRRSLAALIARLAEEPVEGRLHGDLARTLRHLTAMPLGDDAARWAEWWKNSAESFEFPASAGGPRSGSGRKAKPEGTFVAGRFFGLEVATQRVIFVIDVSGSMLEAVKDAPKELDTGGEKPARIEVAKLELVRIIDGLTPGSLFNVISFSTGVDAWLDGLGDSPLVPKGKAAPGAGGPRTGAKPGEKPREAPSEKERERNAKLEAEQRRQAREYVERLGATGATNLYDALELAFEDPLVDTLFVLSDGQPTHGKETDPQVIRADVQRWNATRRIRIHTVSVGTDFEILKWLAADSGGEHRWVR